MRRCIFVVIILLFHGKTLSKIVDCDGKYGDDCQSECHCLDNTQCDLESGACPNGCAHRYTGKSCQTRCHDETFSVGGVCIGLCHCAIDDTCRALDGTCVTGGCSSGWKGLNCQTECDLFTFGQNCTGTCHCQSDAHCDPVSGKCPDGCAEGYTGLSCDSRQPIVLLPSDTESGDGQQVIGMWVGGILFLILVVMAILGAVIYRTGYFSRILSSRRPAENEPDNEDENAFDRRENQPKDRFRRHSVLGMYAPKFNCNPTLKFSNIDASQNRHSSSQGFKFPLDSPSDRSYQSVGLHVAPRLANVQQIAQSPKSSHECVNLVESNRRIDQDSTQAYLSSTHDSLAQDPPLFADSDDANAATYLSAKRLLASAETCKRPTKPLPPGSPI